MRNVIILFLALVLVTSCVPKNQYDAAVTELNYYRGQSEKADSLETSQAISTYNSSGSTQLELDRTIQQLESVTATNISLNRSFQDLRTRYDELLEQNQQLLSASGEQVSTLQQNLADRAAQVSAQEQALREKELELLAREQQLAQVAPNANSAPTGYGQVNNPLPATGSTALTESQSTILRQNQLQSQLSQSLIGYPRNEVSIYPIDDNKVQLTMAEGRLFSAGFDLSPDGQAMLQRIAQVFQAYPTADYSVVGHAHTAFDAVSAYENSTDRAISVTQYLVSHGIDARQIIAAGQGYYNPIAANDTPAGQAANRRTDIIITLE